MKEKDKKKILKLYFGINVKKIKILNHHFVLSTTGPGAPLLHPPHHSPAAKSLIYWNSPEAQGLATSEQGFPWKHQLCSRNRVMAGLDSHFLAVRKPGLSHGLAEHWTWKQE